MILEVHGLSKSFTQGEKKIEVLSNLDLSVDQGETLAIIGQSGSGKSTLLSLLAGLDQANAGSIHLASNDISNMDEKALAKLRATTLSIVFQQFHLMPTLTALENVSLPLEIRRESKAHEIAQETLERVGLKERTDHFPHQLSGGENQRVAIARAFVTNPKILLADEPTGNLDHQSGQGVFDLLLSLVRESKTSLILVTHNRELAATCDRMLMLKDGSLAQVD